MNLETRIDSFAKLGDQLGKSDPFPEHVISLAIAKNPWFTQESIKDAIKAITSEYLDKESLRAWVLNYSFKFIEAKTVALILAGNIPLVGFHDILSVLIYGHNVMIKMSDRDSVLTQFVLDKLIEIEPSFEERISVVDRIKDYDAVIATGSDTNADQFRKYFSHVPHVIRSNRHSVGVIRNEDNPEDLAALQEDVFKYFGLGCRNVSKLYLEEGFDLEDLFKILEGGKALIDHNKYKNNYDYNHALFLLNKEKFYTNNFILLREDPAISSRIATLNYEYFTDLNALKDELRRKSDEIQCILSAREIEGLNSFRFGHAQCPSLMDYADNVDTIQFLAEL